jgi:hypothetical protein
MRQPAFGAAAQGEVTCSRAPANPKEAAMITLNAAPRRARPMPDPPSWSRLPARRHAVPATGGSRTRVPRSTCPSASEVYRDSAVVVADHLEQGLAAAVQRRRALRRRHRPAPSWRARHGRASVPGRRQLTDPAGRPVSERFRGLGGQPIAKETQPRSDRAGCRPSDAAQVVEHGHAPGNAEALKLARRVWQPAATRDRVYR